MTTISAGKIPPALKELRQWVLWKNVIKENDKPTKVPFQVTNKPASSTDAATWNTFDAVRSRFEQGGFDGIGIVFREGGDLCGIDLDGCRNPETGEMAPWARHIVEKFATYTEVSPSQTGVKLFCAGKSPLDGGKKKEIANGERLSDKTPAIEVYDRGRYFAVTGLRVKGSPNIEPRQDKLDWLKQLYWPPESRPVAPPIGGDVIERARKYIATMPPAVSGQSGHNATFRVACVLAIGFALSEDETLSLLREYNAGCNPPWSDRELVHKAKQASKQGGERGYLRDKSSEQLKRATIPNYQAPPPQREHKVLTLEDAAKGYIDKLESGKDVLITTGLPELDNALAGGLAMGEMVVLAALSSHGKSAVALQLVHEFTRQGMPCFIDSEEMTALNLGKRALQWITPIPERQWAGDTKTIRQELAHYSGNRAPCYVVEAIGNTDEVVAKIDEMVAEKGVKVAVVDYTQYLTSAGKSKYEQVSATSVALKQCAIRNNIILLSLVQMNRDVEKRPGSFKPAMSDIKDSGQIGQDADVIIFLCWPWRLNNECDKKDYMFFIAKNRNRGIRKGAVKCQFIGEHQMFLPEDVKQMKNYSEAFDGYNDRGSDF